MMSGMPSRLLGLSQFASDTLCLRLGLRSLEGASPHSTRLSCLDLDFLEFVPNHIGNQWMCDFNKGFLKIQCTNLVLTWL